MPPFPIGTCLDCGQTNYRHAPGCTPYKRAKGKVRREKLDIFFVAFVIGMMLGAFIMKFGS